MTYCFETFPGMSLYSQQEGGRMGTEQYWTATTNGSCKLDSGEESTKAIWPQDPFPRAGHRQRDHRAQEPAGRLHTEALLWGIPMETQNKPTCHKSNLDTWQCFVPGNSFQYFSWSILEELLPQVLQKMYINTWKTQDSQPLFSMPTQAAKLQPLPFNREKPSSSKPCGKWLQHISLTSRGQPSTRIQNSICRLLFKFLFKIREKEVLTIISVG